MIKKSWSAPLIFLIGLGYILIPVYVFPICEFADREPAVMEQAMMEPAVMDPHMAGHSVSAGHSPEEGGHMVCYYTWRAEIGVGLAVMAGALALLLSGAAARRGVFVMLSALAAIGALYPTVLIGVCPGASMPCRTGTLPALVILSGLLLALSAAGAARAKAGKA
jgi:hypothetical protein